MCRRLLTATIAACVLLGMGAGCSDDGPSSAGSAVEATTAGSSTELVIQVLVDGLSGPTQIVSDGAGGFVLAELNGTEGGATGRVVHFGALDAAPDVLIDGLLTPTGVAVDGDLLWVMEQRRLTVGPLADPSDRTTVLDDLPFNGRSEGTLSSVPGGGILFDTSGRRDGDQLVAGSGTLWYLAGPDAEPEIFATGFKHAYAHTSIGQDLWLVTEVSDGQLNGGSPPDELMIVARGDDFGYPRCIGDGDPVIAFDVPVAECEALPSSHALFAGRATPTGVAIAPWAPDQVLVALWNAGQVVSVPLSAQGRPHLPTVVVDSIDRPQHLLVDGERVLVTDHAGGRVLAIHV